MTLSFGETRGSLTCNMAIALSPLPLHYPFQERRKHEQRGEQEQLRAEEVPVVHQPVPPGALDPRRGHPRVAEADARIVVHRGMPDGRPDAECKAVVAGGSAGTGRGAQRHPRTPW